MAQFVSIAKHDKRKRLVLPDDFVAEAPYGEYIIREGKGHLSIVAIPPPKTRRTYAATPALERKACYYHHPERIEIVQPRGARNELPWGDRRKGSSTLKE